MGLSSVATTCVASPAAKAGFNAGSKLRKGASVADIANETKEKFGNDVDTFKKTAKTVTAVAAASGATAAITVTGTAGKIAGLIPDAAKTKVSNALNKVAATNIGKQVVSHGKKLAGAVTTFAKAHPVATAVLAGISLLGANAINKVQKEGAKNEGKIEQKYADILDLKNAAAKDLG